jgi:transcriptional regulator NrdR family protein
MVRPATKGICCPKHPTARLRVLITRRKDTGIVERYRTCTVPKCTYRVTTEERVRPAGGCRKDKSAL